MKTTKSKTKRVATAKKKEWRPEVGKHYYTPYVAGRFGGSYLIWYVDSVLLDIDKRNLELGLACRTKAQALRKARAMLEAAKETK